MQNDKSTTQLQEALKEKMSEIGISVHALEKQAGLKRSAVQNILHGRSKNPSAHILHAVAKILGCNINELLNHSQATFTEPSHITEQKENTAEHFNIELYAEAARMACDTLSNNPPSLNTSQSLRYIKEIYQYALDSHLPYIDKNFATWLAGKYALMVESRF